MHTYIFFTRFWSKIIDHLYKYNVYLDDTLGMFQKTCFDNCEIKRYQPYIYSWSIGLIEQRLESSVNIFIIFQKILIAIKYLRTKVYLPTQTCFDE